MKALVCIDNNLKIDSRLKRHIKAMATVMEEVYVLARPIPNHEFGLDIPNVKFSFFEIDYSQYSDTSIFRKAISDLGVSEEIADVCPFIDYESYYNEDLIKAYDIWLSETMKGDRWQEVLNRIPEEMSLSAAMSYIYIFLLNSAFMAKEACSISADIILCNDVDTLLCGVAHKKKFGSRLVYDIHDATYDISPGVFPLMYSKMLMRYEYKFSTYPDCVMSVGKHLLQWVQRHYGLGQPCVPMYSCNEADDMRNIMPKHYGSNDKIKIYFHGAAYPARKLDVMVQALPAVPEIELVFRCDDNEYIQNVRQLAEVCGVTERVHFLDMVPTKEVARAANRDGDVGIYASVPDGCINWASSFTNKFVEYLGAGLPVLTTKAEDQMQIVKKYNCGFILEDDSVQSMERAFQNIVKNRKKLNKMSKHAWKTARRKLNWSNLESLFLSIILNRETWRIQRGSLRALNINDSRILKEWDKQDAENHAEFEGPL